MVCVVINSPPFKLIFRRYEAALMLRDVLLFIELIYCLHDERTIVVIFRYAFMMWDICNTQARTRMRVATPSPAHSSIALSALYPLQLLIVWHDTASWIMLFTLHSDCYPTLAIGRSLTPLCAITIRLWSRLPSTTLSEPAPLLRASLPRERTPSHIRLC